MAPQAEPKPRGQVSRDNGQCCLQTLPLKKELDCNCLEGQREKALLGAASPSACTSV